MKSATDPSIDYKAMVERGYDRCGKLYGDTRQEEPPPELDVLASNLRDGAAVLEVGCGGGIPITKTLATRFTVTGVDISAEQVRRARDNVPAAEIIHGDIMARDFAPDSFDAAVSFYAVLHLPREEHAELFDRIHGWLKPRGYLFVTLVLRGEPPYIEEDFFGVPMYWSHFAQADYSRILSESGFRVLHTVIVGHGFNCSWKGPEERHPLILAQRE
jgi:cyclopropane fatty-acyl-phospholipid synthase-like methyltransferase